MRIAALALTLLLIAPLLAQQSSWIVAIEGNARFRETAEKTFAE